MEFSVSRPLRIDLTGKRFGRLTVIELLRRGVSGSIWKVRCDCGQEREVRTGKLRSGEHKSCGCLRGERMRERHAKCRVFVVDGKRRCARCKTTKPVAEFSRSKKTLSGLQPRCKRCSRGYEVMKKFGLTLEQHDAIYRHANGRCEACGSTKNLNLDHDHATGRVRGILCGKCNRALGLLRDDLVVIQGLYGYLKEQSTHVSESA